MFSDQELRALQALLSRVQISGQEAIVLVGLQAKIAKKLEVTLQEAEKLDKAIDEKK